MAAAADEILISPSITAFRLAAVRQLACFDTVGRCQRSTTARQAVGVLTVLWIEAPVRGKRFAIERATAGVVLRLPADAAKSWDLTAILPS